LAVVDDSRVHIRHGKFLKKLAAYLIWLEDYRHATNWDEIGESDAACQNPPELSVHDFLTWQFYGENCSLFIKDFNLLPGILEKYGFTEDDRQLLFFKMNMIHSHYKEREGRGIDEEINKIAKS